MLAIDETRRSAPDRTAAMSGTARFPKRLSAVTDYGGL